MKITDIWAAETWFFSLTLQIDWAAIYKDASDHENNWTSYLSNPLSNCKLIITGTRRKLSCILLCLCETLCMEKSNWMGAVRRTAKCSFPWEAGKHSWHLLYPRMRKWLKLLPPSSLHFSLLFHHLQCAFQILANFISLRTSTVFFLFVYQTS